MKVIELRPGGLGAWQRAGGRRTWSVDGEGAPWWSRGCTALVDKLQALRVARRPAPPAAKPAAGVVCLTWRSADSSEISSRNSVPDDADSISPMRRW